MTLNYSIYYFINNNKGGEENDIRNMTYIQKSSREKFERRWSGYDD